MDSHLNVHVESQQTLHDFVLGLLTDADARSAFDLDPEGALRAAGLSDITAADVQDVVPLVMDYVPAQGITGLPQVGDPVNVDGLVTDPTDAISQLQSVTQQIGLSLPSANVDPQAWTLGAIAVDSTAGGGSLGLGSYAGAGLSGADDVAVTLDTDVVGDVQLTTPVAPGLTVPAVPDVVGGPADGLLGTTDPLLAPLGDVTGLVDSVGVGETLDGVGGITGVVPDPSSVTNLVPDTGGVLTGSTGIGGGGDGLAGGLTGGLTGDGDAHAGASGGGQLDLTDGLF